MTPQQRWKKISADAGLLAIKAISLLGKLLAFILRIGSGFFSFIFKRIFSRILVIIYYEFFRLKNSDLTNRTWRGLIGNQFIYLLIFVFTIGFVFFNLSNQSRAQGLNAKVSHTVMAQLVPGEFGVQQAEILVEETAGDSWLATRREENYLDDAIIISRAEDFTGTDDINEGPISFNEDQDAVIKPLTPEIKPEDDPTAPPVERTEIVQHTVQAGDTVSTIAQRYGITINTILWANNLGATSLIRPGDKLTILPTSGLLYTVKSGDTLSKIAGLYAIEADRIALANPALEDGLKIGQQIILPGAKRIAPVPARVTKPAAPATGISVIRDLIKAPDAPSSSGKMVWPTVGSRITQYFSWRHNGIDIANKVGTPIYAADDGTVEIAATGYNGGYGNTILINHGGGVKTRYGHASKLFVKVGDTVKKGENIAAMGSTGRSTGPHLHFEVIVSGTRYNPLNYVK